MRKHLLLFLFLVASVQPVFGQRELAYPQIKKGEIVIQHTGHTLSYNPQAMIPYWVAYQLHATDMEGDAERARSFSPDPSGKLKRYKLAEHWHYTHSGWCRGHMAPAGDMKYSQEAMNDSFYTTNICPMDMTFNNGIWKRLEEKIRKLAIEFGSVYIVTGPIIGRNINGKVGESDIIIPDAFYKAILVPYKESYLSIAFIMKNEAAPKGSKLRDYTLTVDELETLVGRDFFAALDAATAKRVESALPLKELGLF